MGKHSQKYPVEDDEPVVVLTRFRLTKLLEEAASQGLTEPNNFMARSNYDIAEDIIEEEEIKFE